MKMASRKNQKDSGWTIWKIGPGTNTFNWGRCLWTARNGGRWKSARREANTDFRPAADLFPGARDSQNLISWRWSLPLPTNPLWWGSMHAISSYRGNRPTISHKPTDRTDYNTLCRS